ncbi:MAG: hypothetical protein ABIQ39_01495, partial [Ilumatobacteraceae bacterium]
MSATAICGTLTFIETAYIDEAAEVVAALRHHGAVRGTLVALATTPGVGAGLAFGDTSTNPDGALTIAVAVEDPLKLIGELEHSLHPRWVLWSNDTARSLVRGGVR